MILASTMNDGALNATHYPANLSNVIGVGATNTSDKRASFSNYGTHTDVAAPGVSTYTLDRRGSKGYGSSDYTNFNSTSAACPVAAGIVGLMASVNPNLTAHFPLQVRFLMNKSIFCLWVLDSEELCLKSRRSLWQCLRCTRSGHVVE